MLMTTMTTMTLMMTMTMATTWCEPCKDVSSFLAGQIEDVPNWPDMWMEPLRPLRGMVNDRKMFWVTVISEQTDGTAPDPSVATDWHDAYPNENIPVVADVNL